MKISQILALLFLLLSAFQIQAQVPQKFNYQGIARDAKGSPIAKQSLALKLSVLPTSDATVPEYEELQQVITNEFGLYTLQIGNGTPLTGNMKTVKWETGNKYIKVTIDAKGGTDFVDAGTSQLLSVPYAIYADKAGVAKTAGSGDRTGTVSSAAGHLAGDANYLSKFTGLNVIAKSQLFDNGTNVGIGTATPSSKLHINATSGNQEHIRMQNTNPTGWGKFLMYNDVSTNYATFTKYGSTFPGGITGVAAMYPYANMLAFGNNLGPFLLSNNGNIGINMVSGGVSTLKFNAIQSTGYIGIGGNATPAAKIHFNTSTSADTVKYTNSTTGHLVTDGTELRTAGNNTSIVNRENGTLTLGTNNTDRMTIAAAGNVGVGTTAPTAKLDVNGQVRIQGGSPGVGKVLTSDAIGLATWQTLGASNQWVTNGTHIYNSNTGNVGIGTNTPTSPLQVASPYSEIRLQNTAINTSLFITAPFSGGTGGIGTDGNYELPFYTNNIERVVIKNDGKVGVGTNIPAAIFDVTGGDALINGLTIGRGSGNDTLNTSIGYKALANNSSAGVQNTAVGSRSLFSNTNGYNNTAVGINSLRENTLGFSNTAIGMNALNSNTTGFDNVAIGLNALYLNTSNSNVAVGVNCLADNITGEGNVGVGKTALNLNTVGSANTSIGSRTLSGNISGSYNTALGYEALRLNTLGHRNTAIGTGALGANTIGINNVAIGFGANSNCATGSSNTTIGMYTMSANNIGFGNTTLGYGSGQSNTGNNNVFIGLEAGFENTGSSNVFIGYQAGYHDTASNRLYIANNNSNPPLIFGNFSNGRVGLGLINPSFQFELSTNSAGKPTSSSWSISSDARLKTVDGSYTRGLADVLKLNTVKYHYNKGNARNLPTEEQGYGFVAQELQQVYPEAVKQNEDGYLSVDFHPVLVSYINAFKELNTKSENQENKIKLLEMQNEALQQQIDEIKLLIKK